jgi:hypothetical protein
LRPQVRRNNARYDSIETSECTLAEYLAELAARAAADDDAGGGGSESAPPYGANNWLPPELHEHIRLPPFFPAHTKRMLDTRLWVGPPGAGVSLHRDMQDNFLLQLHGRKRQGC